MIFFSPEVHNRTETSSVLRLLQFKNLSDEKFPVKIVSPTENVALSDCRKSSFHTLLMDIGVSQGYGNQTSDTAAIQMSSEHNRSKSRFQSSVEVESVTEGSRMG